MIRTCGPRFRKPVLYPTELRGLFEQKILYYKTAKIMIMRNVSFLSGNPDEKTKNVKRKVLKELAVFRK